MSAAEPTKGTQDTKEMEAAVKAGAHFYMAHVMEEYPHPDAPEITMGRHTPNDPNCPGCRAEAALAVLVAQAERASEMEAALRETIRAYDALLEGEAIDRRMGYPLPGDSALAATFGLHADEVFENARSLLAEGREGQ